MQSLLRYNSGLLLLVLLLIYSSSSTVLKHDDGVYYISPIYIYTYRDPSP